MKSIFTALWVLLFFTACHHTDEPFVERSFMDSLMAHYSPSVLARTSDSNLLFWKKRMDSLPDNFINGPEYASALSRRFHIYGDIHDLLKADSLFKRSNESNQGREPGIFRTLASLAMLQHQFLQADSFLQKAKKIDDQTIPNTFLDFDITFERGNYRRAKGLLESLKKDNSYGYLFMRSKFEHYDGNLDSAIACMMRAAEKAGSNKYLKQVALSNAADLYIHKGDLQKANNLYMESIKMDAADFHSIMGIGWIALVHDKNDSLAQKIFRFVATHSLAPDVLLKLEQVAESGNDSVMQKKYAAGFILKASDTLYGTMYNKYLVDLYTGIMNDPAKAVILAAREINSRPTPQVYAWYAWSLFCNDEKEKAYTFFKRYVSGRPLEGLELYYMGKMMQELEKGYNAQQFFKAAYKNRYDLSPAKQKYLKENSE